MRRQRIGNAGDVGGDAIVNGDAGIPDGSPGVGDSGDGAIAPDSIPAEPGPLAAEPGSDQPGKRKRGRPPGSGRKPASGSTSLQKVVDADAFSAVLFSTHAMLAAMMRTPELRLDETEAAMLGKAAAQVAKHYPVGMSEKTAAWIGLVQVAAMVYGPRIFAVRKRTQRVPSPAPHMPDTNSSGFPHGLQPVNASPV